MRQCQRRRVEHGPLRAAVVGQWFAVEGTIVDAFAAQGNSAFTQMDTHLMRAARFQATFDESEGAEGFDDAHMRDGALALAVGAAATAAVATIGDQDGFDALVL